MKREPQPPLKPTSSLQPISLDVLREKDLKPGETTADELYQRVARALASVEKPELRDKYEGMSLSSIKESLVEVRFRLRIGRTLID